ncbi:MAG TPA: hypothetical protein VK718_04915 [Ferruginibacter sp.]|jgi:hypothetical protein|nr:hypothetical protein [Ferruginibacter sp.]
MIPTNPENSNIKTLSILHKTFLVSQIILGTIAFFLVYNNFINVKQTGLEKPLQIISIILSVGGFIIGNAIFKMRITSIKEMKTTLSTKLEAYRGACIIQYALIEGPCLFTILGFLLTGDYSFLFLAGALVMIYLMLSPSKEKIVFQLELSDEEATQL